MSLVTLFYIFLVALFSSLILIPPVSRLAVKIGGVDRANERKIHSHETPRLGGVAIFFAFLLSVLLFIEVDREVKGFLIGAIIIFLTGLADDLMNLSPAGKFIGEVLAALACVGIGRISIVSLGNLFGFGNIELHFLAVPFTVFAVVGVMNAINLIDGLDGLAGGVSTIACLAFSVMSFKYGNEQLLPMTMALMGATMGFLRYNTFPARIFMGDSGSLFLGYCLAFFSIILVNSSDIHLSPMIPVVILGVPIFDALVVMMNRLRKGYRIFSPDKTHIHHRLLDLGVGHKLTVILVYGVSYLFAAIGIALDHLKGYQLSLVLFILLSLFYFSVHLLARAGTERKIPLIFSNQSIRETSTYRRIIAFTRHLALIIKYLLLTILLLSMCVPPPEKIEIALFSAFLLLLYPPLFFMKNQWSNQFLQLILYFSGAYIIFVMENFGADACILDVSIRTISHVLFFALIGIEGVKILLRKRTTKLINSPFEYFIFFLLLSVPLLPQELTDRYNLITVVGKSVTLFVAFKLILMHKAAQNRKVIFAISLVLLVFVWKGLTG